MDKSVLFMLHNLGLGDVLSFAPLFLSAFEEGYMVDVAYSTGGGGTVAGFVFGKELYLSIF